MDNFKSCPFKADKMSWKKKICFMLEKSSHYVTTLQNEENRRWQQMQRQISVLSQFCSFPSKIWGTHIKRIWLFSIMNNYYLFLVGFKWRKPVKSGSKSCFSQSQTFKWAITKTTSVRLTKQKIDANWMKCSSIMLTAAVSLKAFWNKAEKFRL